MNQRAQGMPGARCTRGLIRKGRRARMSIQAQRRHPGIPCAMVYGLFRALPGDRACLPPSPAGTPRKLDASVGRQDHTALPSAPVPFVFDTVCVHRIPRQRFVTTMIRPSERARDGALKPLIWGPCEAESCPSCHCAATRRAQFSPSSFRVEQVAVRDAPSSRALARAGALWQGSAALSGRFGRFP